VYSVGRYFASRAESVLGGKRVEALKLEKGRTDPHKDF
jgi:hypothetical protein